MQLDPRYINKAEAVSYFVALSTLMLDDSH